MELLGKSSESHCKLSLKCYPGSIQPDDQEPHSVCRQILLLQVFARVS
jgi:hypothetical protein